MVLFFLVLFICYLHLVQLKLEVVEHVWRRGGVPRMLGGSLQELAFAYSLIGTSTCLERAQKLFRRSLRLSEATDGQSQSLSLSAASLLIELQVCMP